MKKLKIAFILLLSLILVLTGCAKKEEEQSEKTTANSEGGEFSFALATPPDTLDPHKSGMAVTYRVFKAIFENLIYIDENNEPQPWLATEWEISEDNTEYTFKLREDVTFHDGEPFNAEAVKVNFERLSNPENAFNNRRYLDDVKKIEVVNDYTIKLTIKQPSPTFLIDLTHPSTTFISPKAIKEKEDQLGIYPVGTGPFKFVEYVENDRVVLEKFENYHGHYPDADHEGLAYLDKLEFKVVPEEATRVGSVQSGQITAAETVPPQDIISLKNNNSFKIWEYETPGQPYGLFINTTTEPWNDVKVRRALRQSIDVDSIVNTLYLGTYKRAWSVISPKLLGYESSLEGKDVYDVDAANKAFDELGWKKGKDGFREKDGKQLTLRIVEDSVNREKRHDINIMIKEQLKEVGVNVEIERTTETQAVIAGQTGFDLVGNSRVVTDPEDLSFTFHSKAVYGKGGLNFSWYKNEQVDKLLEQGDKELDPEKRAAIYKEIQRIVVEEDVVKIPVYVFPYTVITSSNVNGLKFDISGYPSFYDVTVK